MRPAQLRTRFLFGIAAGTAIAAVLAGSVLASSIVGTAKADHLRGTAGADVIHGLAGNDTIAGLGGNDRLFGDAGNDRLDGGPGNDVITGGAGADRITCGPGKDTVHADLNDSVAADCEVVLGLGDLSPAPTPTPEPPPAPPPPPAQAGHYSGMTSQLTKVDFDVSADGTMMLNLMTGQVNQSCDPPDFTLFGGNFGFTNIPIAADGTFSLDYHGTQDLDGSPATYEDQFNGKFSGNTASGTLVSTLQVTNYNCYSGTVTWTATKS